MNIAGSWLTFTYFNHGEMDRIMEEYIRIKVDALRDFTVKVFQKLGVPAEDAGISADILITADQRGISSHGVQRLRRYVQEMQAGTTRPTADIKVIRETPNTILLSGGDGLGFVVAYRAMRMVIDKALKNNVALASVRDSNHFGIAGYYAMMALPHDLIGISLTNTTPTMPPTFGIDTILGTNPIAIAIPTVNERPVVLDMATSIVTAGKLELHRREGKKMPLKWAIDEWGNPSDDAAAVMDSFLQRKRGGLLPLGGAGEEEGGYKGYGLSFMVDILCGVLAGSKFGTGLYSVVNNTLENKVSHFFGAIRLEAFTEPALFKRLMDEYIHLLRNSTKKSGQERIFIHGEKEWESYDRQKEAVSLYHAVVAELREIGREFRIEAAF
jgi:LDH2 family malate/lactate/ureidoglycolate dehydrogenase